MLLPRRLRVEWPFIVWPARVGGEDKADAPLVRIPHESPALRGVRAYVCERRLQPVEALVDEEALDCPRRVCPQHLADAPRASQEEQAHSL